MIPSRSDASAQCTRTQYHSLRLHGAKTGREMGKLTVRVGEFNAPLSDAEIISSEKALRTKKP